MIEQVPDETLVAYLDGELAAVEATQVEVQLKANESLRRRLDELRGTWELLGDLPLEQPDPRLAETTIELIGLSLERSHETWLDRCYRYRWWLTTCAGVLGLLLGVFWSQWQHERNERQLLERVPVLANFKLLQELVSPVWLEKIASIPELEELTPAPYEKPVFSMVTVPPGLEERTAWVKGLSNAEKKRLRDNAHSLDSLDEEKRQSLQSLSEMVFQDTPQGQEYRSAVQGYARLLNRLETFERVQLPEDLDSRATEIKSKVWRELALSYGFDMSTEDMDQIELWRWKMEEKYPIPDEIYLIDLLRSEAGPGSEEYFTDLRDSLSRYAQDLLSPLPVSEQRMVLANWIANVYLDWKEPSYEELLQRYEDLSREEKNGINLLDRDEALEQLRSGYSR